MSVKDSTIHSKINSLTKKQCRKILKKHGLTESKVITLIINEITFRKGIDIILRLWAEDAQREWKGINKQLNEFEENEDE